jgi:hypothetical protein
MMDAETMELAPAEYWWNSVSNTAAVGDRCLTMKYKDKASGLWHTGCTGKAQILCEVNFERFDFFKKGFFNYG